MQTSTSLKPSNPVTMATYIGLIVTTAIIGENWLRLVNPIGWVGLVVVSLITWAGAYYLALHTIMLFDQIINSADVQVQGMILGWILLCIFLMILVFFYLVTTPIKHYLFTIGSILLLLLAFISASIGTSELNDKEKQQP